MQPCFRVETSWCRWYQGAWLGKSASHVGRVVLVTAHRDAGTPREGIHAWDRGTSISEGRLLGSWKAPRNDKSVVESPTKTNSMSFMAHKSAKIRRWIAPGLWHFIYEAPGFWIVEQDADVSYHFCWTPKITQTQPTFRRVIWCSMCNVL